MINEIEQEFYEAFGVEKISTGRCKHYYDKDSSCYYAFGLNCKCSKWEAYNPAFLPITPEIVLKLQEIIMLVGDSYNFSIEHINDEARFLFCEDTLILENESNLKDCIIKSCIHIRDEIQEEVRKLFKQYERGL